jgi:hypothetical protein
MVYIFSGPEIQPNKLTRAILTVFGDRYKAAQDFYATNVSKLGYLNYDDAALLWDMSFVAPGGTSVGSASKLTEGAGKVQAPQKVIGHYPEYVEISNKLGTKPFSIPDNIWSKMTPSEQWAANQKFLDRAIAKGSEFNLATPINKVRPDSFLQKEINYLMSQGYKLSSDGTKLVK